MKLKKFKSQSGFAVGPVLVVVALIAIIGAAFTASNRGTSANTANETAKTNAGLIGQQAAHIKTGIERHLGDGVALSNIIIGGTPTGSQVDVYDTNRSYAVVQTPPPTALATAGATWAKGTINITGVGTAVADDVLMLTNINDDTCQRLNNMLHNVALTATPTSFGSLTTATPPALASGTGVGKQEGCAYGGVTAGNNTFYTVIRVN